MNHYKETLKVLKEELRKNPKLTKEEWNEFAHEEGYFSAMVILDKQEIVKWEDLRDKFLKIKKGKVRILDLSEIYKRRKKKGYSLKAVSNATGINVKRLRKIELTNDVYLSDLIKLARFYDTNIEELYKLKF